MFRESKHQKSEKGILVENTVCLRKEKTKGYACPLDLRIWIVRGGQAWDLHSIPIPGDL